MSNQKYQIIYADPPWKYQGGMMNASVTDHYSVMDVTDIAKFPVASLADDNCALFMWVTMPKLNECFGVIKAWGFEYKTVAFTWVKSNKLRGYFFGQGRWTRGNAELCLLATKGSPHRIRADIAQLVVSDILEHSHKPTIVRELIVQLMGDLPRVELFSRHKAEGWDSWGNEVESDITLDIPPLPDKSDASPFGPDIEGLNSHWVNNNGSPWQTRDVGERVGKWG